MNGQNVAATQTESAASEKERLLQIALGSVDRWVKTIVEAILQPAGQEERVPNAENARRVASVTPPKAVELRFPGDAHLASRRYEVLRAELVHTLKDARGQSVVHLDSPLEKAVQNVVDDLPDRSSFYLENIFSLPPHRYRQGFKLYHSLNVGLLSALIGAQMGLSRFEMFELALAGLLHDVGMLAPSWNFLLAPRTLRSTETRRVRIHTLEAERWLKGISRDFPSAALVAVQHHERSDGSGYPYGITERQIHPYAKVVGMADEIEGITHARPHRTGQSVNEFFERHRKQTGTKFSKPLWKVVFQVVGLFPPGTRVRLTTGSTGTVVYARSDRPLCPVVRLDGENPGRPSALLDLSTAPQIQITGTADAPPSTPSRAVA